MSILVILLNQDTKECDPNISNLKAIFDDSFYKIEIKKDYREALKFAHKKYPSIPSLIIKDNSVITHDIKPHLDKILSLDAHIHFLCSWGDLCHQYTNAIPGVKWTNSSYASQAVLYMPISRQPILNRLKKSDIETVLRNYVVYNKATVFIPNIVHFDIDLAKCNQDFLKLNGSLPIINNDNETYNNQMIWIIIIIITLILLAIGIPYYKKYKHL